MADPLKNVCYFTIGLAYAEKREAYSCTRVLQQRDTDKTDTAYSILNKTIFEDDFF
jgi:hypothetical protein